MTGRPLSELFSAGSCRHQDQVCKTDMGVIQNMSFILFTHTKTNKCRTSLNKKKVSVIVTQHWEHRSKIQTKLVFLDAFYSSLQRVILGKDGKGKLGYYIRQKPGQYRQKVGKTQIYNKGLFCSVWVTDEGNTNSKKKKMQHSCAQIRNWDKTS